MQNPEDKENYFESLNNFALEGKCKCKQSSPATLSWVSVSKIS